MSTCSSIPEIKPIETFQQTSNLSLAKITSENGNLFSIQVEKLVKKQKTMSLSDKPPSERIPFFSKLPVHPIDLNRNNINISEANNESEDEDDEKKPRIMTLSSFDIKEFNKKLTSFESKKYLSTFLNSGINVAQPLFPAIKTEPFLAESGQGLVPNSTLSEEFIYDLEIVSNRNEKEIIKVSFQPSKGFNCPSKLPNAFDRSARDEFFNQHNFTLDYQNGYAPIAIQAQQETEFSYKDHFIRR